MQRGSGAKQCGRRKEETAAQSHATAAEEASRQAERARKRDAARREGMTANTSPEDIRLCEQAGMNAHIAKPFEEAVLWRTLTRFLPPAPAADSQVARPDLFDPAVLQQLRELTTAERFEEVVRVLLADCEGCCRRMGEAVQHGDEAALGRAVHGARRIF